MAAFLIPHWALIFPPAQRDAVPCLAGLRYAAVCVCVCVASCCAVPWRVVLLKRIEILAKETGLIRPQDWAAGSLTFTDLFTAGLLLPSDIYS